MNTKKKKSSELKRLGDPIGRSTIFILSTHMHKQIIYIDFIFVFTDDILKRNLYFTKLNKLSDHHLGKDYK